MFGHATPGGAVAKRATLTANSPATRTRTVSRRFTTSLCASLLVIACGDSDAIMAPEEVASPPSLADAELRLVSGDQQEGEVGSLLPTPLVVEVRAADGSAFPGAPVEWTFSQGQGALSSGQGAATTVISTTTDQSGRVSVLWRLGTRAGPQQATASIPLPSPAPSFADGPSPAPNNNNGKKIGLTANASPGDAESLSVSPNVALLTVGDSAQLTATTTDKWGNVLEAAVDWSSSDPTMAPISPSGMVHAMGAGSATVTAKYGKAQGSATVSASQLSNVVPIASIASPAQNVTITLGQSVDFRGSASDADGSIASHAWSFGDGTTSSVQNPGPRTYGVTGTYDVTYRVTDDDGAESTVATRTVTVTSTDSQAPTASINAPTQDVTITLGEAVTFQGSATDPDGTVTDHSWWFGDGNTASVEDPGAYTYTSAGSYDVTYRVGDDQGTWSNIAQRTVTVVADNVAPSASITRPSQDTTIIASVAVSFQGTASDSDGSVASHAWSFGDGATSSVQNPGARTYSTAGTYSVTYRVTDDDGAQSIVATRTITVSASANQAPTASITSPTQNITVTLGQSVDFRGSASDPDGSVASHAWSFGNGTTASVEDPGLRTYGSVGTYNVTYRVTNDDGAQSTLATRTVTVTESTPPPSGSLPAQLIAANSWTSGTGTALAAVTDASRSPSFNQSFALSSTSVQSDVTDLFPSDNYLQLVGGAVYMNRAWSPPAVGEHVTFRWLQRWDNTGSVNPCIYVPAAATNFCASGSIAEDALSEWQVSTIRTASSSYRIEVRVFTFPGGVRTQTWTESNFQGLAGQTFTSASGINSLAGFHIEMVESFATGTHPIYPTSDITGENFSSTAWSQHNFHGSGSGVYMRISGLTITRGSLASREWPIRAWGTAEDAWNR